MIIVHEAAPTDLLANVRPGLPNKFRAAAMLAGSDDEPAMLGKRGSKLDAKFPCDANCPEIAMAGTKCAVGAYLSATTSLPG
jgi:hypothetical protein